MKRWLLLVSTIAILLVVSSPVFAISKVDLMKKYQAEGSVLPNHPATFPTKAIPTVVPFDSRTIIPVITPAGPRGSLQVITYPEGANISLDGTFRGISPTVIFDIPEGLQVVRATKEGWLPGAAEISILRGRMSSVIVMLRRDPSWSEPLLPAGDCVKTCNWTTGIPLDCKLIC